MHRDVALRRAVDAAGYRAGAGAAPRRGRRRAVADRLDRRHPFDPELVAREGEAAAHAQAVVREPGARAQGCRQRIFLRDTPALLCFP
jgi:hypothetical protein